MPENSVRNTGIVNQFFGLVMAIGQRTQQHISLNNTRVENMLNTGFFGRVNYILMLL